LLLHATVLTTFVQEQFEDAKKVVRM